MKTSSVLAPCWRPVAAAALLLRRQRPLPNRPTRPKWPMPCGPSGKIYVVVAVVVVIVAGLLVYLISLDRKVSRLEKVRYTNDNF